MTTKNTIDPEQLSEAMMNAAIASGGKNISAEVIAEHYNRLCGEQKDWRLLDPENKVAAAIAHRVCCSEEHNPEQGKINGYCVVCGVSWPCETAKHFLFADQEVE